MRSLLLLLLLLLSEVFMEQELLQLGESVVVGAVALLVKACVERRPRRNKVDENELEGDGGAGREADELEDVEGREKAWRHVRLRRKPST